MMAMASSDSRTAPRATKSPVGALKPLHVAKSAEELLTKECGLDRDIQQRIEAVKLLSAPESFVAQTEEAYIKAQAALGDGDQEEAYLQYGYYHKAWTALEETGLHLRPNGKPCIDSVAYEKVEDQRKDALWRQHQLLRKLKERYKEIAPTIQVVNNQVDRSRSPTSISTQDKGSQGPVNRSRPIDLYMAESFDELKGFALSEEETIKRKLDAAKLLGAYEPYFQDMDKIYQEADRFLKDRDEEGAFLRFMAHKMACQQLEDSEAFSMPRFQPFVKKMMDQQKETVWQLNRLESSLINRYQRRFEQEFASIQLNESQSLRQEIPVFNLGSENESGFQFRPPVPLLNISKPPAPLTPSSSQPVAAPRATTSRERRDALPSRIDLTSLKDADPEPQPLYVGATCLNDLEDMSENTEIQDKIKAAELFPTVAYPQLIQEIEKILEHAINFYMNGDQEMAFVYLSQFVQTCHMLNDSPNFRQHKQSFQSSYDRLMKSKDEAIELRIGLRRKLMDRYTRLQMITPEDLKRALQPNDEDANADEDAPVAVDYILLIDCRYSSDFEESHVSVPPSAGAPSLKVINVPVHECEGQLTLQSLLDRHSGETRQELEDSIIAKRIVIMDWDSESLMPETPVTLLYQAFSQIQWLDDRQQHLSTVVLKGGFTGWFMKYPQYTTNQQVTCRSFAQQGICPMQIGCPFVHLEQCPICKKLCIDPDDRRARNAHIAECAKKQTKYEANECKICQDNSVDRVIQPCGHVACNGCLSAVQARNGGCPFCRQAFTSINPIFFS